MERQDTRFHLERNHRTPHSESWSILERHPETGRRTAEIADVEAHLEFGTAATLVKGYKGTTVWRVDGVVVFHHGVTDEQARGIRDLLDDLFSFCFTRDFTLFVGSEWGVITRDKTEFGPSELRKKVSDTKYRPLR